MNFHRTSLLAAIVIAVAICLLLVAAQPASTSDLISIGVNRPGAAVSPGMFGIFFEDINFAADGGLYPELVKNRSFEFTEPLNSWNRINVLTDAGELIVNEEGGLNPENPHYLRVRTFRDASGLAISNGGFRGMGLRAGSEYVLSAYVRAPAGTYGKIRASVNEDGGRERPQRREAGAGTGKPRATHAMAGSTAGARRAPRGECAGSADEESAGPS